MDLEEDKEAIKSSLNNDTDHLILSRPTWSWLDVL